MGSWIEKLVSWDRDLFYRINTSPSTDTWDWVMVFLSSPYPWVLLLVSVVVWGFYKHGKQFWKLALALVLLVSITDLIAYRVFKPNVGRLRPCIELTDIRKVHTCGGEFGFPSNHSANAMAITFFLYLYFRNKSLSAVLIVFTGLVGYSRIYLGAHYPLDVLAGYFLGTLVAVCIYLLGVKLTLLKKEPV